MGVAVLGDYGEELWAVGEEIGILGLVHNGHASRLSLVSRSATIQRGPVQLHESHIVRIVFSLSSRIHYNAISILGIE